MSLFYFHIRKGPELERAVEPITLANSEDIAEEAIELARDLLAEGDLAGLDRRGWVFEVEDEAGVIILNFPFSEAVEPDLPETTNE